MWHEFDWGWGMGFHMLAWWALVVAGIIAVAALIFLLARDTNA
ncbi:MAG TPA: hypothetical protein VEV21_13175 [Burkholderiales bacterium]|nr:hypothetical protein [Burkholderiales bacterium]